MNLAGSDSWSYQATLYLVGPMDHDGLALDLVRERNAGHSLE